MAKSVASGFTISGLLDRNASTRSDYPVERIPVGEIADHPANAAYSMDDVNSALAAPKMAVQAGGSADAMSDRDAGGTGTLSAEAAQTSTKLIYTANLTIESKDFDAARTALTDAVSAAGGYLESSNESSYTGSSRTLSLTIRVPQDNYASFLEAAAQAGAIVLATTPQSFADILPRVGRAMRTDALVMSIAAGYGIAAIREGIGRDAGIIRIMPNVNANVCASTTGYATSASITAAQLDAFHFAFGKIGELIELDESEFETFSAIAGCGVAYVYMFIDAMARAGLRNGLSKQKALSIAASAVMGSAKLVSESGMHPYALIDSVTTPGGTTIEGVLTLQRCGFESAVHAAIQASIDKELGMK